MNEFRSGNAFAFRDRYPALGYSKRIIVADKLKLSDLNPYVNIYEREYYLGIARTKPDM